MSTCPASALELHPASDVAVFGSDHADVRHFRFYFHWLKSRLLCALGKKCKLILVLQAEAHILQVRCDINRTSETEVVGLSTSLLRKYIQTGLRQMCRGRNHGRRVPFRVCRSSRR